ncbi:MAG: ABC transporter ATP-binding protein, partial [Hyphomicrobiales bacterium]
VQDRDIGMVFQSYALFPHLSVFENVAFPLRMRKHSETEIKAAVGSALEMIRLSHVSDRLPRALSGGQQQRIALARCLVYKPSIILMDEPLGALDRKLREEMQLEIKRIHRATGTTLLYVTHDQDEAMTMSDRICLMKDGRIEHLGSPDELYFAPKTEFTADFLGSSNFIDAEVSGRDGERTVLSIAGGKTIKAVLSPSCAGKKHIRVMIRPERTVLGPAAPGSDANEVSGTVSDSILAGGFSRVYVDVPGIGVLASSYLTGAPEQAATPGTSQSLHWPVSATLTFPGKE